MLGYVVLEVVNIAVVAVVLWGWWYWRWWRDNVLRKAEIKGFLEGLEMGREKDAAAANVTRLVPRRP